VHIDVIGAIVNGTGDLYVLSKECLLFDKGIVVQVCKQSTCTAITEWQWLESATFVVCYRICLMLLAVFTSVSILLLAASQQCIAHTTFLR
jgi:hypothetical protein